MKILMLLIPLFLASCASHKNLRSVDKDSYDGLRYESLNRYNIKRLQQSKLDQKAIALCHQREYNQAYKLFKQQLDNQKDNPTYWNHIATCNLLESKPTRAKFYFDLALSTTKKNKKIKALIMNNLGLYYLQLNRPYLAKESFEKSISLYPKFKTPKYNLAQVLMKFSQFDKATKLIASLLNDAPKDVDFIYSMGHVNLMQGNYAKANKFFSQVPDQYLTRDDIATNYAMSLYFVGHTEKAYKVVKNADMNNSHYLFAQTELIKKIERTQK